VWYINIAFLSLLIICTMKTILEYNQIWI
jgi:hypothetical protein